MIISKFKKKWIKRTLVYNGSDLNISSVNLLDKFDVEKLEIQPDSLSIKGFDNVEKQPIGVINLPILVRLVTFQTPIHVMPNDISYNILLG